MKKAAVLLLISLVLTGCGTPNVRKDYSINEQTNKGLVVGSITQSKSIYGHQGFSAAISGISFRYRNLSTGKTGRIEIDSALLGPLYSGDFSNAKGELFVVELDPGSYIFEKWHALQGSYTSVTGTIPQPIEFSVYESQAVYVGNLHLEIIFAPNIFGIGIVSGGKVVTRDKRDRDISLFEQRYPNLKREELVYELVQSEKNAPGKASRETSIPLPLNL